MHIFALALLRTHRDYSKLAISWHSQFKKVTGKKAVLLHTDDAVLVQRLSLHSANTHAMYLHNAPRLHQHVKE